MLHVSIKAEEIFNVLGVPVTNSLLASFIVVILFLLIGIFFTRFSTSNSTIVFFIRFIMDKLYSTFEPILGSLTHSVFPIVASIFLFVLLSNWLGLLPGFGSITLKKSTSSEVTHSANEIQDKDAEHSETSEASNHDEAPAEKHEAPAPILRGATADLNTTIALGIIAFITIQFYGIKVLGISYFSKFLNFKGPIDFFTGILEIISEFSKIISFAFRLFGNIFAGEVLLAVVAFLVPILASFPFLLLEVFVGFVQALVFAMLTAVFINSATAEHH